jgi:hypothetical protein
VLGFASPGRIAQRFALDRAAVEEHLLDHQARGRVAHSSFAGSAGWYLTPAGRAENERRLAAELDATNSRSDVQAAHRDFLPLNQSFGPAATSWQVRPSATDPLAANDHSDWRWDERVLRELRALERQLGDVCTRLSARLQRFDGYAARYSAALAEVDAGQRRFVDAPEVDSCHTVWVQLHEDLLATLGIPRGTEG